MRSISKGREPKSLTAHRQISHGTYENYREKQALRNALVAEQRGLCCYCLGRIRPDTASMKIEHWRCQSRFPERELNYGNLLAACHGSEGEPRRLQHCDTKKGDQDLDWNPADPEHHIETRIGYKVDGTIYSDEEQFNTQLREVLNLNLNTLKAHRKRVLDSMLDWWKVEKARIRGRVPAERLRQKRAEQVGRSGELAPYSQVAAWWLDQKLARMGG